jgi:hypothetical protein
VPPPENSWVYTCPKGTTTPEIAAALGVLGQPITEVSAQTWQQDWQMANAFMAAYDYPKELHWRPRQPVGWNGLEDWMLVKAVESERTVRGQLISSRFVGELVIVRHSWEAAENTLAFLLDIMQAKVDWWRKKYHSQAARIVLVLEGWERPTLAGRVGKRVAWTVNPLPLSPSS